MLKDLFVDKEKKLNQLDSKVQELAIENENIASMTLERKAKVSSFSENIKRNESRIQELEEDKEQLIKEHRYEQRKLQSLKAHCEKTELKFVEYENEIERCRKSIQGLHSEKYEIETKNNHIKSELKKSKSIIDELNIQVKGTTRVLSGKKNDLSKLNEELELSSVKVSKKEFELSKAEDELSSLKRFSNEAEEELKALAFKESHSNEQLRKCQKSIVYLSNKNEKIKNEIAASKNTESEIKKSIKILKEEMRNLNTKKISLETRLQEKCLLNKELENKYFDLNDETKRLREEIEELKLEESHFLKNKETNLKRKNEIEQKIQEYDIEIINLKRKNSEEEVILQRMKQEITIQEKIIETRKSKVEGLYTTLNEVLGKVANLKSDFEDNSTKLEDYQRKTSHTEEMVEREEIKLKKLQEEVSDQISLIEDLSDELDSVDVKNFECNKKNEELSRKYSKAKTNLKNLSLKIKISKDENVKLNGSHQKLNEAYKEYKTQFNKLNEDKEKYEQSNIELREKVSHLECETKSLKSYIEEMEDEKSIIENEMIVFDKRHTSLALLIGEQQDYVDKLTIEIEKTKKWHSEKRSRNSLLTNLVESNKENIGKLSEAIVKFRDEQSMLNESEQEVRAVLNDQGVQTQSFVNECIHFDKKSKLMTKVLNQEIEVINDQFPQIFRNIEKKLNNVQERNVHLIKEQAQITKVIEELNLKKSKLHEVNQTYKKLMTQLEEQKTKNSSHQLILQSKKDELLKKEKNIEKSETELNALVEEEDGLIEYIVTLEDRIATNMIDYKSIEQDKMEIKTRINNLNDKVESLEKKSKNIQKAKLESQKSYSLITETEQTLKSVVERKVHFQENKERPLQKNQKKNHDVSLSQHQAKLRSIVTDVQFSPDFNSFLEKENSSKTVNTLFQAESAFLTFAQAQNMKDQVIVLMRRNNSEYNIATMLKFSFVMPRDEREVLLGLSKIKSSLCIKYPQYIQKIKFHVSRFESTKKLESVKVLLSVKRAQRQVESIN